MKDKQKRSLLREAGWTSVNRMVWYPPSPEGTVHDKGFLLKDAWQMYLKAAPARREARKAAAV